MSVRTARSPVPFRPSSGQANNFIHKPHPPYTPAYGSTANKLNTTTHNPTYGSIANKFNREATTHNPTYGSTASKLNREGATHRPLPRGPGPLDDKGHKLKLTDYNSNYTLPSSSFRPKKSSLPSTLGSSNHHQPLRANHSSDVGRYYTQISNRQASISKYSLLRTGSHRSRSISDLTTDVSQLQVNDSTTVLRPSYKESSFGNVSDRIERSRLISYSTNNSPGQRSYKYSEPTSYVSRSSYLSSSPPSSRLSKQDSCPSSESASDGSGRSSSRTHRNLNRSSSLLSPLNDTTRPTCDKEGLVGLSNLGNTCFLNAIVQCLSHTKALMEYCLKEDYHFDLNTGSTTKGQLIQAYAQVMNQLWKPNKDRYVSPRQFKSQVEKFAKQFAGYSQQDAQEFLRFLLEGLHEDVNAVKKKPCYNTEIPVQLTDPEKAKEAWQRYTSREKSHISELFVGQLKSTLECCTCGFKSVTFDPFWDLSLPIPRETHSVLLEDCLQHFTRSEVLEKEEKPMCDRCKSLQVCTKTLSIQRFPQVLVIHLKRFSGRSKLSTFVDFPLQELNLEKYAGDPSLDNNFIYNLHGTVNHFGSIYGGHYVAVCKHAKQQKWYKYDDERVEMVSSGSVKSSQAYVLFYEQDGVTTTLSHL